MLETRACRLATKSKEQMYRLAASLIAGACTRVKVLLRQVYSFGVTLWEILEKRRPFDGLEGFQIQAQWYSGADMTLPPVTIPDGLSNDSRRIMLAFRKLVADCTSYDPDA